MVESESLSHRARTWPRPSVNLSRARPLLGGLASRPLTSKLRAAMAQPSVTDWAHLAMTRASPQRHFFRRDR